MRTIEHRIIGTENEYLSASLSYSLGGNNVWTGKTDPRGYYMIIRKVKRQNGMYSYYLGEGVRVLLKEVKRKSKKAEQEAEQIMNETYEQWFIRKYPDVEYSSGATIR